MTCTCEMWVQKVHRSVTCRGGTPWNTAWSMPSWVCCLWATKKAHKSNHFPCALLSKLGLMTAPEEQSKEGHYRLLTWVSGKCSLQFKSAACIGGSRLWVKKLPESITSLDPGVLKTDEQEAGEGTESCRKLDSAASWFSFWNECRHRRCHLHTFPGNVRKDKCIIQE